MTAEEKIAIIRNDIEHWFCHYAALAFEGLGGSEVCIRKNIYKDLLEYIDKVIAEDEDYAPKGMGYMDEEVVEAARKKISGLNIGKFNATKLYIRGFDDGQYWRQQKLKAL